MRPCHLYAQCYAGSVFDITKFSKLVKFVSLSSDYKRKQYILRVGILALRIIHSGSLDFYQDDCQLTTG